MEQWRGFMHRIIWLALFLGAAPAAWGVCPDTPTDCLYAPIYKTAQGWAGLLGGPWTTSTRPGSPVTGLTGFNTTLGAYETWNGSAWTQVVASGSQQTITAPWTFNVGPILLPGSTPGTPVNGQMWLTPSGLYYESQGVTIGPLGSNNGASALTATTVTANAQLGVLPASGYVLFALFHETAGHNVSVGIGTSSGTTNVLPPQAVPANGTLTVAITGFSLGWFSASAPQTLFLSSASWGSAAISAELDYKIGP